MTQVGTREEWLAAREELLEREKELTRMSDELARRRRELPWVPVEKEYVFETNDGPKTLAELFDGRSQLLVYHFMHGPHTPEGCVGCTYGADHWDRAHLHLAAHDVTFLFASRSPLSELNAYKERMGWDIPWVSSGGTDFNEDFSLFTEEQRRTREGINFGSPKRAGMKFDDMELMALSVFALEDGVVYHTYSAYDRGTDVMIPTWQFLDRTPKGRFRAPGGDGGDGGWPKKRDEYTAADLRG
jgi:predicted dithiol-disulfide oxidoreductase (DUF899 family)